MGHGVNAVSDSPDNRACQQCRKALIRGENEDRRIWPRRRFCDDECRKLHARDCAPERAPFYAMTHEEIAERLTADGEPMTRRAVQEAERRALKKIRIALGVDPRTPFLPAMHQ